MCRRTRVCSLFIDSRPESLIPVESRDALIKSLSLLKRNALAAPFEHAFQTQRYLESGKSSTGNEIMAIHYRDEEAIYVQAAPDRVTVIFSTVFREETDRIFGKVFLQVRGHFCLFATLIPLTWSKEFVDARRLPTLQNAPQVLYSNRDPPLELRGVSGLKTSDDVGYVTFGKEIIFL